MAAELMVPITPVLAVVAFFILITVGLLSLIVCNFMFVSQNWTQLKNGIKRVTNLVTMTSTDMWIEAGEKEFENDILYKPAKGMFKKKGSITHADDNKLKNNSAIRWGRRNLVLFYWISKIWPKGVSWMAAQQRVLEIAGLQIDRQGNVRQQHLTLPMLGYPLLGSEKLKVVLDKLHITKPYLKMDNPEAVLKYNEYLCLIVGADKKKALTLIKDYVNSGFDEKDKTFLSKTEEYLIVPDMEKKEAAEIQKAHDQLIEEIKMVCEFCRDMLVPPTVIALREMMKANPDTAQVDDRLSRIQATYERKNAAKQNTTDTKTVIMGFVTLEVINIIFVIILMAVLK
jgi:hypothetical protein